MIVERDQQLLAALCERERGGDLEEVIILRRSPDLGVGDMERTQRSPNAGLERGEAGELALQRKRAA
jgi:hypothetical protein